MEWDTTWYSGHQGPSKKLITQGNHYYYSRSVTAREPWRDAAGQTIEYIRPQLEISAKYQ